VNHLGADTVAIQKALQNWVVACTGLAADHVIWAGQQGFRPTQPAIVMKLQALDDDGLPWIDRENNYITFDDIEITDIDTDTFTATAHGRLTGDGPVQLEGDDLPLNAEEDVNYWIIKDSADTFRLATSYVDAINGVPLTLGDTGSGDMFLVDTDTTTQTGGEIKVLSRSLMKAMLTLQCYTNIGTGIDMATATLWRVNAKRLLPTPLAILEDANIGVIQFGRVLSIGGTQDLVFFEPRAVVDIMIHFTSEETENISSIERTEITNEDTSHTFTVEVAE
jgi:hypothetical protein